jgi:GNAT superfamily N-acetyltransferase
VSLDITVWRADVPDARAVAQTLCEAFQDDPVSGWLIPDPQERRRRHPGFFRVFVDHAIVWGEVHTTCERNAAALWLEADPNDGVLLGASPELFGEALGPHLSRFEALDERMSAAHPGRVRHAYLPFVGVRPAWQGRGVGAALLDYQLRRLDTAGLPAYLEASCPRSLPLYQRLGFTILPTAIDLPGGPRLQPMWRDPQPATVTGRVDDSGRVVPLRSGPRQAATGARWPAPTSDTVRDHPGAALDRYPHPDRGDVFPAVADQWWINGIPLW